MSEINWQILGNAPDVGQATLKGLMAGQQQGREMQVDRALQAYAQNPDAPEGLAALMRADPRLGIQVQERQRVRQDEQRITKLKEAREQIGLMDNLLSNVTDEASFQQARQAAQGMGMDLSQVPPSFDPQWIGQTKMQARALAGKLDRELMAVAPGTVVIDKSTARQVFKNPDRPRYYPVSPGGRLELDPSYSGGAISEEGAITRPEDDSKELTATNPQTGETVRFNPQTGQWEPMGGASQGGSPTFP